MKYLITATITLTALCTSFQSKGQLSQESIEKHVYFLANDSLEGRLTGTEGEKIAYTYIINRFQEIGLESFPSDSYLHNFSFRAGKEYGKNNFVRINGKDLKIDEDYYPIVYSGNGSASSKPVYVNHGLEKDYKKELKSSVVILNSSPPSDVDPHSEEFKEVTLRSRLERAAEKGASSIMVINTVESEMDPAKDFDKNIYPMDIPVVFVKDHILKELNLSKIKSVEIGTDLIQIYDEGNNVIAFKDNPESEEMVVIGAHYDHLGWGIPGSRYRGETPMIHNGADDNASGVAMMIELARYLNELQLDYDYCFIAFSGEELGLYGSKSIFDEKILKAENINYMINMDMVGRLDEDRELAVNGVGTSSVWKEELEKHNSSDIKIVSTESGNGPSDHASFYFNNIPVLHFFTGTHTDYHHPDDDAHKVNYEGMVEIGKIIADLVVELDSKEELDYIKTKDESIRAPRFTVTLGVMPDYMFEGKGMRIDGVTEGKVADKAGIVKGDIVIKLGDHDIVDMMTYMEGLSKFKKGDKTTVEINRGGDSKKLDIIFE